MRRVALTAIVVIGCAASLYANFPGHFSPDSLWQLAQGRSGVYNEWHPPAMAWLLGVADRLRPGASLFIFFDAALFYGGLLAFAVLEKRPRLISMPLVALLTASPLVLIYQGVVWKDVLFADAALAGFAALAWSGRAWARPPRRFSLLLLAFALFSLAALSRQNGWVVPMCGALALVAIRLTAPARSSDGLGAVAYGLAALAVTGAICGAAGAALAARDDGKPETARQLRRLQVFDLAGAVRADPSVALSILHREAPVQEEFIRRAAAPVWTATGADNLKPLAGADTAFIRPGSATSRQWRALLLAEPILYLRTRAKVFASTLLASTADKCLITFTGVDGPPRLLARAGLSARYDDKDSWDEAYETTFVSTPVFSHVFYGAILIVLLLWRLRDIVRGDRRPETWSTATMAVCALLFTASFFVISSACDYRYLYFLDVAAMAALVRRASERPAVRPPTPSDRAAPLASGSS